MNTIQNPIIVGLLSGIVVYIMLYIKYNYWDEHKTTVQLHIPIIITLSTWFIYSIIMELCYKIDSNPIFIDVNDITLDNEKIIQNLADF